MFRFFSLFVALFVLVAWDDIDGKIDVYQDFALVDEDGRYIELSAGTHEADFSYNIGKGEIELEIDDIDNGKDRDFEFQIPGLSKEDFHKERLQLHFSDVAGDRDLEARLLVTNEILSKGKLEGKFRPCREHGSVVFSRRPIVYRYVDRVTHIALHIGSSEDTLALFEGSKHKQGKRVKVWVGECGGDMPDNLADVVPE